MKFLKTIFLCLLLFSVSISAVKADVYSDIAEAIRNGDAKEIAKFFENNVNLTILGQEDIYSKAQAEQLLNNFFNKNTPRTFTLVHQGGPESAGKFVIGNLVTSDGKKYRVTIHVKKMAGEEVLQELRIETE
ncbi:MAG: DUF4783 domain-containing protein [Bacteroidetes bacterium]|nr:DUF4783 domain-containing protein [Bacteroidota bacterium]